MASIIEREAVLPSEQEKIASVFLSRLNIDMKLQADPTSSYGFYGDYGKKIGRAVLDDKNPYNTYQNKGLPPGPICYPSKGAIDAAIKSSPGEFYYFVAKGDGSHIFSKTSVLGEILKLVVLRYQQINKKENILKNRFLTENSNKN